MIIAAGILIASLGLTFLVHRREATSRTTGAAKPVDEPLGRGNSFALIARDRYLLVFAVVSRVIKYAGLRAALVLVPFASVAGYGAALAAPLIGVLMIARIAESTLDYSLSNTTRQALWLVTSSEAKYKAKQVIDTFVMRAGYSVSAGLVWIGARTAMSAKEFIAVNLALTFVWLGLALLLGRIHARRTGTGPGLAEIRT
jgi:AAA family ATP:ADP antiporter